LKDVWIVVDAIPARSYGVGTLPAEAVTHCYA